MIAFRAAAPADAARMAEVQNAIFRAGLRATPVDTAFVQARYLAPEHRVACTVAEENDRILGFQSLTHAWPGNPYGAPEGWGIIGTHIHPDAGRRGIGRSLFAVSLAAAQSAGLEHIDASIGADNAAALSYYRAMGFTPYRHGDGDGVIPHRFDL